MLLLTAAIPADLVHSQEPPFFLSLPPEPSLLDIVKTTISRNPTVSLQRQQVAISRGSLQQAAGQFDDLLSLSLNHSRGDSPVNSGLSSQLQVSPVNKTTTTSYKLSFSRLLRQGITLSPSLSLTRTEATSDFAKVSQGVATENRGSFSFVVTVPLMKGFGRDATTARETAARYELDAENLLLKHSITESVSRAAIAYWNWVSAVKRADIARESEQKAGLLLENTRKLIEHDQKSASSIYLVQANLSSKRLNRISSEQALHDIRRELGLIMGLNAQEIAKLGLPAGDELPPGIQMNIPGEALDAKFIDLALKQRSDLLALLSRERAAQQQLIAAHNNILPRLDLNLQAGYNSLTEKNTFSEYFTAYGNNLSGPNTTFSLNFAWPIVNNEARGLYLQQKSAYEKTVITTANLTKSIGADVANTLSMLRKSLLQLAEARSAVLSYRKAVESEYKKFTMGAATLNDVVNMENYLVVALQDEVANFQDVAVSITNLRYQTGSIMASDDREYSIDIRHLTTLPEVES